MNEQKGSHIVNITKDFFFVLFKNLHSSITFNFLSISILLLCRCRCRLSVLGCTVKREFKKKIRKNGSRGNIFVNGYIARLKGMLEKCH